MSNDDKQGGDKPIDSPKILTSAAALITAIGGLAGLITALHAAGFIKSPSSVNPSATVTNIGSFEVKADSEEGFPFVNPQDKTTRIRFRSEGAWTTAPGNPAIPEKFTSPKGYVFKWETSLCPEEVASALVVKMQRGECLYIGEDRILTLAPKEAIQFYINDDTGGYFNNQGLVKVSWEIEN